MSKLDASYLCIIRVGNVGCHTKPKANTTAIKEVYAIQGLYQL